MSTRLIQDLNFYTLKNVKNFNLDTQKKTRFSMAFDIFYSVFWEKNGFEPHLKLHLVAHNYRFALSDGRAPIVSVFRPTDLPANVGRRMALHPSSRFAADRCRSRRTVIVPKIKIRPIIIRN